MTGPAKLFVKSPAVEPGVRFSALTQAMEASEKVALQQRLPVQSFFELQQDTAAAPASATSPASTKPPNDAPLEGRPRTASYKPAAFGSYSLSGKELETIIRDYQTNNPNRPLLTDILFRIEEDLSQSNLTVTPISSDDRNKARDTLISLSHKIAGKISGIETSQNRRATTKECIEAFNAVLYDPQGEFKFPEMLDDLRATIRGRTRTLSAVVNSKVGVCEDMTGVYLSLVDLLSRQGLKLEVQAKRAPGHVFATWVEDGKETNVELTNSGKILSDEEYQKRLGVRPDVSPSAIARERAGGIADELFNCSIALARKRLELSQQYIGLALALNPSDSAAYDLQASYYYLGLGKCGASERKACFDKINAACQKALELDPDLTSAAELQVRLLVDQARREDTPEAKSALFTKAINYVEDLVKRNIAQRPAHGLLGDQALPWDKILSDLYLDRYGLTKSADDLASAWSHNFAAITNEFNPDKKLNISVPYLWREAQETGEKWRLNQAIDDLGPFIERRVEKANRAHAQKEPSAALKADLAKLDPSLHDLRKALADDFNPFLSPRRALELRAGTQLRLGHFSEAETDFRLVLTPSDFENGAEWLHKMAKETGRSNKLESEFVVKADRSAENIEALTGLAACLTEQGKSNEAAEIVGRIKEVLKIKDETFKAYCERRTRAFREYQDDSWLSDKESMAILGRYPALVRLFEAATPAGNAGKP